MNGLLHAEQLGELPAMTGQLGAGRIGTEHADALASAASGLDDGDRSALFALDAELATHAASSTPEQFRRQLPGDINGRGSVSATDDADGCRVPQRKVRPAERRQAERAEQGGEDPELCRRAEKQRLRVGQQRPEVGHCTDSHEDDQREGARLDADEIGKVQQAVTGGDPGATMESRQLQRLPRSSTLCSCHAVSLGTKRTSIAWSAR